MIEQVFEHRWPSALDLRIAVMTVRLDDIAARFSMEPQSWDEDGLGPTRGVGVRLPSGRIVLILEHEHAIKHLGAPGFQLVVDGGDAVSLGIDALVDEVLRAFGLSESAIAWKAGEDARQFAARAVAARRARS